MLLSKIDALKKKLIIYADFVESMIDKSIVGLLEDDDTMLQEVIEKHEQQADDMEIELDDMCTTFIGEYQPSSKDLRSVLMVLKMNNDLERIADLAVNIAENGLTLIGKPRVKPFLDIPRMAAEAKTMLKDSIKAFVKEDLSVCKDVCDRDNVLDGLRDQVVRELITFMSSDPFTIERSLNLIKIARSIERIGDLATNICEDAVYVVEGRIVKHHKGEYKK
ncbi:phosphate signaling complex protein PhoU [bacterium]|nr:phosphate signaling complex protein PhoU [bacterium]